MQNPKPGYADSPSFEASPAGKEQEGLVLTVFRRLEDKERLLV